MAIQLSFLAAFVTVLPRAGWQAAAGFS